MDGLYWNIHLEMDENWGYPHDFGNLEFIQGAAPRVGPCWVISSHTPSNYITICWVISSHKPNSK